MVGDVLVVVDVFAGSNNPHDCYDKHSDQYEDEENGGGDEELAGDYVGW